MFLFNYWLNYFPGIEPLITFYNTLYELLDLSMFPLSSRCSTARRGVKTDFNLSWLAFRVNWHYI